jgi:cell division transport system permease protein
VLTVAFATRGAMAANRPTIEVLHFIGATDRYIAAEFQRHFLVLGLKGGILGGGAAVIIFMLAGFLGDHMVGTASGDEVSALFGSFAIGLTGYFVMALQIAVIAAITAGTSRRVVANTLSAVA